jgi:hypothetical protein
MGQKRRLIQKLEGLISEGDNVHYRKTTFRHQPPACAHNYEYTPIYCAQTRGYIFRSWIDHSKHTVPLASTLQNFYIIPTTNNYCITKQLQPVGLCNGDLTRFPCGRNCQFLTLLNPSKIQITKQVSRGFLLSSSECWDSSQVPSSYCVLFMQALLDLNFIKIKFSCCQSHGIIFSNYTIQNFIQKVKNPADLPSVREINAHSRHQIESSSTLYWASFFRV